MLFALPAGPSGWRMTSTRRCSASVSMSPPSRAERSAISDQLDWLQRMSVLDARLDELDEMQGDPSEAPERAGAWFAGARAVRSS